MNGGTTGINTKDRGGGGILRIAISGKSGCGNTSAGKRTAEILGLTFINYTFRNLAEERGVSFEEAVTAAQTDTSWDRAVDERQVELAAGGGCVLSSRLAIWMLKENVVRVYLEASPEVRAARIVKREGGDLAQKAAFTAERDRLDRQRYLKLYGIDNDDYSFADLIIDTGSLDIEAVAGRIVDFVSV